MSESPDKNVKRKYPLTAAVPPWEKIDLAYDKATDGPFAGWLEERLLSLKMRNLRFLQALEEANADEGDANERFLRTLDGFLKGDAFVTLGLAFVSEEVGATAKERRETIAIFKNKDKTLSAERADMLLALPARLRAAVVDAEARIQLTEDDVWSHVESRTRDPEEDYDEDDDDQLTEAINEYLAEIQSTISAKLFDKRVECLQLFNDFLVHYTDISDVSEIDPVIIWEFLGSWYMTHVHRSAKHALETLRSVRRFLVWLDEVDDSHIASECRAVFKGLSEDLPVAFHAMEALFRVESSRPEPRVDENSTIIDCFEIRDIEGTKVNLTLYTNTGTETYQIELPEECASLLKPGFLLNATIAARPGGAKWDIVGLGLVLPRAVGC